MELTVWTLSRLVVPAAALCVSLLLVPLPAALAPPVAPGVASFATDSPPTMPPVMTVHYAGDSTFVFRDDATSADRSVYPDDGLSEGVFGPDEATFSATRYRETDDDCNGGASAGAQLRVWQLMQGQNGAHSLRIGAVRNFTSGLTSLQFSDGLPGEVRVLACALAMTTPAGPSLVWSHTYRSCAGTNGLIPSGAPGLDCGTGNFASWDVRIEAIPPGAGSSATQVALYGGDGRQDVLGKQADGTFTATGMFRDGEFHLDGSFTLTFADRSTMTFRPLDGSAAQGKIATLADRNGVALTCAYGGSGELLSVSSQFGQSLTCTYGSDGRLATVADQTGRFVQYLYYGGGGGGGSDGDLASISCAQILGQTPLANPVTFTYTTGNVDDLLNHNLLTVSDGAGRVLEEYQYSAQPDPTQIDYDKLVRVEMLRSAAFADRIAEDHGSTYTILENDPLGRLTECDFDSLHRCIAKREYTGFCTPGVAVTSTTNRPTGQLRASDPAYFETSWEFNAQSLCTRETLPDGTQLRHSYECDLHPGGPVREGGNERITTFHAPNGDERSVSIDYLAGFGTNETIGANPFTGGPEPVCASNPIPGVGIVVKRNPGSSNARIGPSGSGEEFGGGEEPQFASNPIPAVGIVVKRQPGTSSERTGFGPVSVGPGDANEPDCSSNPIPGVGIVVKRNPKKSTARSASNVPPNTEWGGEYGATSNMRSRINDLEAKLQAFGLLARGVAIGTTSWSDLSSAAPGANLKLGAQNGGVERVGSGHGGMAGGGGGGCGGDLHPGSPIGGLNIKGGKNPGGGTGGASNRPGNPIGGLTIKGGKNPGGGMATSLVTSLGQEYTWSYDANGNCTAYRTPISGGGCDFSYNALGQCTSETILNGPGSSFTSSMTYDATTLWELSQVDDPAGLQLARSCVRDALGRITQCTDARGFDGLTEYDALDRVTRTFSPPLGGGGGSLGSRVVCDYFYDAAGLLCRFDVEHRDETGALDAADPAESMFLVRDAHLRITRVAKEQRPVFAPPPVLDPALLGIANFATTDFAYDAAGQCVAVSSPAASRGQPSDAMCAATWDERGLLYLRTQGIPGDPSSQVTLYDYDLAGACVGRTRAQPSTLSGYLDRFTFDRFHRLESCTDPMGNVVRFDRDATDLVTCTVRGELRDVPGSSKNTLLARARGRNGFDAGSPWHSPFFGVVTSDHKWYVDRSAPDTLGAVAKQTAVVHHSPAGLVLSVTNDGDTVLEATYDSAGRSASCSDGKTIVVTLRDAMGNAAKTTRTVLKTFFETGDVPTENFTVTRTFDAGGRCTGATDGAGNHESWAFDSYGRCTLYTDANGFAMRGRWDGSVLGGGGVARDYTLLLEADVDGDGTPERLRDLMVGNGEILSVTNSNGDSTLYHRDALGRVVEVVHPDGTTETSTPDDYGQLKKYKRQDGAITTCDFDSKRRVTSVTVTGPPGKAPVPPTVFTWDGLDRVVAIDEVGATRLVYTYDSLGNQLSEMRFGPGPEPVGVTRTFDGRGRRSVTYSSGESFVEMRDALGELVSVWRTLPGGALVSPPVTQIDYVGHRPLRETRENGVVTTWDYRSDGEPALPGSGDLSFDECVSSRSVDASGVVLLLTDLSRDGRQDLVVCGARYGKGPLDPGRRHEQTFDPLHRLVRSVISRRDVAGGSVVTESDVTYTLDLEGLRLTATGGANPGAYTQSKNLPPGDRQMGQYTKWPGGRLQWDDDGNLVKMQSGVGIVHQWHDALDRLVRVSDATGTTIATYEYDGVGRRTRSTVASSNPLSPPDVTDFVYDGPSCIEECDDAGAFKVNVTAGENCDNGFANDYRSGKSTHCNADAVCMWDEGAGRRFVFVSGTVGSGSSVVVERVAFDDAWNPIWLKPNGKPRVGATHSMAGYDWIPAGSDTPIVRGSALGGMGRWCPETGFTQCHDGTWSPQLGRTVCKLALRFAKAGSYTLSSSAAVIHWTLEVRALRIEMK